MGSNNSMIKKLVHMKELCSEVAKEIDDLILENESKYNYEEDSNSIYDSMSGITNTIDLKDVANEVMKSSSKLQDDLIMNLASENINNSINSLNENIAIVEAADKTKLVTEEEKENQVISDAYNNITNFDFRTEDDLSSDEIKKAAESSKFITEDEKKSDAIKEAASMVSFDEELSDND